MDRESVTKFPGSNNVYRYRLILIIDIRQCYYQVPRVSVFRRIDNVQLACYRGVFAVPHVDHVRCRWAYEPRSGAGSVCR